jgi:dihydrofolate synthase/folylpolyglutamate synthase
LLGQHQHDNATLAVAGLYTVRARFDVPQAAILTGLRDVEWPGRLQVLGHAPTVVVDGAHNAASADVLGRALREVFVFERLILVVGLSEGKDARGVLEALAPDASEVLLTRSRHERSAAPSTLEPLVRSIAPTARVERLEDPMAALDTALARAQPSDLVLVTGSLFLVGEALVWWHRSRR